MAYEPINRKGIYSYETVNLPDGSRWTWKPIRDRWETTGDLSYDEWIAKGGTSYVYNPLTDFNPIQQNQSIITGTGEEILNTNNTQNTLDQIQANINQGSATQETLNYIEQHIDFTVQISKQPNRGSLFVGNIEDNFTSRNYNSKFFEQGGFQYEVRENETSKSKEKYKLVTKQNDKGDWLVVKEVYINGQYRPDLTEEFTKDGSVITLPFNLSEIRVDEVITTPIEPVEETPKDDVKPTIIERPILTLSGDSYVFDLSNNSLNIPYRSINSDKVVFNVGSVSKEVSPSGILTLSSSDFTKVGQYKIYAQPISNLGGSGEVVSAVINVTNTINIPGPDIRNIIYPEVIKGQDFKGYDVDFRVSWSSVNTNWVNVYVGKVDSSTQLYENRPPQGELILNVRDVLTKAGFSVDSNQDYTDFKLLFVPYNNETSKTAKGKTEQISIRFDKGNLKLQRGSVVRDIRESIAKQFNTDVLKPETSKYLTHLLHLGEGNNKVITTWGTDTETLSEFKINKVTGQEEKTKEVKSLVLKLYEPLGKEVQPNQQVWVSKIQSIPLIEQVTVINESVEECIPLQPNFNVAFTDNVGLQIYDDLIASGSTTSTTLINQFVSSSGFDLKELDIQFVSSSTTLVEFDNGGKLITESVDTDYYWSNFVKYSSAKERVENYIYKINTIDFYLDRLDLVISDSHYTSSIALQKEKESIEYKINDIKVQFDAFEDYLYTNEITSSTESNYSSWYGGIIASAEEYDYNNTSRLTYNLPQHILDDKNNSEYVLFFDMMGQHFDTLYLYNKEIARSRKLEHKHQSGLVDKLVYQMLESLGWDADLGIRSQALWDYAFGTEADGTQTSSLSGKNRQNETWRRILNNLPYLLKTKGTKRAISALLSCYGVPSSMLTVMEFGGPRDITQTGTTSFTYEDRTAAINLSGSSAITVDWKQYNGDYPNTVEVRLNTTKRQDQQVIVGSDWSLDILKDTGSLGRVQLTVGSDFVTSSTLPIFDDEYYHLAVTRESGSEFTLYVKQGFQERIRNEVSAILSAQSASWESGSSIQFGSPTFTGSIDELRLWSTPLTEIVIENHTLVPDAINGNHNSASSEDLIFRNDFEYPKDRNSDTQIKNVSLIQTYVTSSVASGFESITSYPYQYTSYDRTVTAKVPSLGTNFSNKFRFEEQYESNGSTTLTATSSIDLSHRQRSTKKSFDKSPLDSDKLGLFFSPIKEINMDIVRSVGPINVDDFIGDPSDDYNYTYQNLDNFREYYFQRYNLNFNEYVQLVRYIERGLFDQLESLVPARAKVAKGLLFEPHILERSKTQWNKPTAQENSHEVSIDTQDDINIVSEELTHLALISASEDTNLSVDTPFFDGYISGGDETQVIGENVGYEGTYVSTDDSTQSGEITRNDGATMGGFEFNIEAVLTASIDTFYVNSSYEHIGGFGPEDLAVAGFGLYGSGSHAIRTRLINGNIIKDRVKVFKFDEDYTEYQRQNISSVDSSIGTEIIEVTKTRTKVSILPFTGSDGNESQDIVAGNGISNVIPLNGTFSTHYRLVEDLTTGMENSFFNGSKQTSATTLDGGSPVQTFTTNPNTLKVSDTGRGSGEPILEVE